MAPQWKRFAPIGLYLSAVALLAAGGLYIVFQEFNLGVQIALGLVLLGLALFAILDPERVRLAFSGRTAKYGSNALVLVIAFLGILVVINYLGYKNSKRWDLTEDKTHTLAKETLDTLQSLPQPVIAVAYYTSRIPTDSVKSLFEDFKANANGKFDYKFIDPESDPIAANQAGITRDGTIILTMGTQREEIAYSSEQEITSGILKLLNPGNHVIYFLTGHGEADPEATDDSALSNAASRLTAKNYSVQKLNLLAQQQIPQDASVIVIAGPQKPISDIEMNLLDQYMQNGGSMVVMEEPTLLTQYGDQPDPLVPYLKSTWGVLLGNDFVIDLSVNPPNIAVANAYGSHAITEKMQSLLSIYPTARSVTLTTDIPDGTQQRTLLVQTAERSWAETDLISLQNNQITADQTTDILGPVSIATAVGNSITQSRLVVFGDSDFARNAYFNEYGNGDMFVNAIDWAANQDQLINLTPKQTTQRVLVPPQKFGLGLVLLGSVFLLPLLVIIAGIVVWVRRRRMG